MSNRPFGVEVEAIGLWYGFFLPIDDGIVPPYRISRELQEGFRNASLEIGKKEDAWRLVEDRSIHGRGAIEVTTPHLRGEKGLKKLQEALGILKIHGANVNGTCGLHVHHDASDFGCEELKNLLVLMSTWEPLIYQAIPNNEKRMEKFCRPLPKELVEQAQDCPGMDCADTRCLEKLWYGDEKPALKTSRLSNTRHHGLNLHSFWFRGTVEFRYMKGTLVWEIIRAWILFTQALMETAKKGIKEVEETPKTLNPLFRGWEESLSLLES